jgi:hypothetical protein
VKVREKLFPEAVPLRGVEDPEPEVASPVREVPFRTRLKVPLPPPPVLL